MLSRMQALSEVACMSSHPAETDTQEGQQLPAQLPAQCDPGPGHALRAVRARRRGCRAAAAAQRCSACIAGCGERCAAGAGGRRPAGHARGSAGAAGAARAVPPPPPPPPHARQRGRRARWIRWPGAALARHDCHGGGRREWALCGRRIDQRHDAQGAPHKAYFNAWVRRLALIGTKILAPNGSGLRGHKGLADVHGGGSLQPQPRTALTGVNLNASGLWDGRCRGG